MDIYFVGNRSTTGLAWPAVGMLRYHAIRAHPEWIMQGSTLPVPRNDTWYLGADWPSGPNIRTYPNRTDFIGDTNRPQIYATFNDGCALEDRPRPGSACDEFPNQGMAQGFHGNGRQPALSYTVLGENSSEGGVYGAFLKKCGVAQYPQGTTLSQIPFGDRFLVIPVAQLGMPANKWCAP